MISQRAELPLVAFSVKIYQMLLFAYPTSFRKEYGSQMMQVFQDCCLRSLHRGGINGILKLWAVTFLDLIQSVISEHSQKEVEVKKEMRSEEIRRSGWALILGAISLVISMFVAVLEERNWSMLALLSFVFVSLPLLIFGVLGLRTRYGDKAGPFGKNILLVGAILGPITSIIGFFLTSVNPLWFVIYTGPAVLFICLTLFGIAAIFTKPLPRWNMLPVLGGLFYPAIILFYIFTSLMTRDWSGSGVPKLVSIILITIQGIALIALGYILKADVPEEKIVTA